MTTIDRHPAVPPQRRGLFATLLLAVLCVIWGPASAQEEPQQQCGPVEKIQELVGKYGEAPLAMMSSDKGPLWLFVNPETGTFTLVAMISPKAGCLLASGDKFQPLAHAKPKPGTEAGS